jgi:transcriptional regulator with XRE-family HTH domain
MAKTGFNTELKRLGKRIKDIRKDRELTLVQLQGLTGIANGTLSRYENAKYANVELLTLHIIAKAMDATLAHLFDYDGPIPPRKL